jgi:hypothetical protein
VYGARRISRKLMRLLLSVVKNEGNFSITGWRAEKRAFPARGALGAEGRW